MISKFSIVTGIISIIAMFASVMVFDFSIIASVVLGCVAVLAGLPIMAEARVLEDNEYERKEI